MRGLLALWIGGASAPVEAAVVVTPPTTPGPIIGGAGWISPTRKPRKKKLVEELDEMIMELRERIVETPAEVDEDVYARQLRVSEALANRADIDLVSDARIRDQIEILQRTIAEIDDEEAILLTLH